MAGNAFFGSAAAINTLLREPIVDVPPLAGDFAELANRGDEPGLARALCAVAWYFGLHLIEEGKELQEHVRGLSPAIGPTDELRSAFPLDRVLAVAAERDRYVATAGADTGFEVAFARFVSQSIGISEDVAHARASADAGPLLDACNRFLDQTLSDIEKSLQGSACGGRMARILARTRGPKREMPLVSPFSVSAVPVS